MATTYVADLAWYSGIGLARSLLPRCPFASIHRCPRYYQSVSLLGGQITTEIDAQLDADVQRRWMASDLWPVIREQETGITRVDGEPVGFDNFCPEVSGEIFGVYASHLHRYADELDHDLAHQRLAQIHALPSDWRWNWSTVRPLHYSDCALYAPLSMTASTGRKAEEVFELKPGAFGIKVDIKALLNRFPRLIPKRLHMWFAQHFPRIRG